MLAAGGVFGANALASDLGATSITGATAESCLALRLVDETFVGDETTFCKALATSAVCETGRVWGAVIGADFGWGMAPSVCNAVTRVASGD
jgi:hypothetical protein